MIRMTNVEKTYENGTHALNGISFEIQDGEFVFLVGPSGSGKSTIIKLLTGEVVPTAGRVMVNDKPAKASYAVKVGDVIEITFGNRPVKVRVLAVEEPKGKDVARELFEVIE